jgi:CRP-like cAMP-binding protein
MDARRHLSNTGLFRGLDDHAVRDILGSGLQRRFTADAVLLRQGDAPSTIFLVGSGRIKMTAVDAQGLQKTLRFMEDGDIIGCAAVFGGFPYPATATATTESAVSAWGAAGFEALMRRYPALATNALGIVGMRAEDMLRRLHGATTEAVDQRIARVIIKLDQEQAGSGGGDDLHVTRQELAELSDTTTFSASRIIAAWHRDGIVMAGRGRLRILNRKKLAAIAGQARP